MWKLDMIKRNNIVCMYTYYVDRVDIGSLSYNTQPSNYFRTINDNNSNHMNFNPFRNGITTQPQMSGQKFSGSGKHVVGDQDRVEITKNTITVQMFVSCEHL